MLSDHESQVVYVAECMLLPVAKLGLEALGHGWRGEAVCAIEIWASSEFIATTAGCEAYRALAKCIEADGYEKWPNRPEKETQFS